MRMAPTHCVAWYKPVICSVRAASVLGTHDTDAVEGVARRAGAIGVAVEEERGVCTVSGEPRRATHK